ncbi:MAG: MoaD family protein [Anaerolineae bacterium]
MQTIKLLATLRDLAGARELQVSLEPGQSVRHLVQAVAAAAPRIGEKMLDEQGELTGVVHIFINGRNIQWLQGLDTIIEEGDEITLIPPAAGG